MRLQLKQMLGVLGLAAVAAMLVAAMGASSAYAKPEFKTHSGNFPVKFLGEGLGLSTFLSEGLNSVTCHHSHSTGEVKSPTDAKVVILYLTGCELTVEKEPLNQKFKEGCPDIKTLDLLIEPLSNLKDVGGNTTKLGLLIQAAVAGQPIAEFECKGHSNIKVKVTGSVVCESTPGGVPVKEGQVICKEGGAKHGTQLFTSGENSTGAIVGSGLIAESNAGIFTFKEVDSQTTTEDVTYSEEVTQVH
jgi:hypothetical protein